MARMRVPGVTVLPGRPWAEEITPAAIAEREFDRYPPLTSVYICSYWESRFGIEEKNLARVERSCAGCGGNCGNGMSWTRKLVVSIV